MLTVQSLVQRLSAWSSKLKTNLSTLDAAPGASCPILVYQNVFALFHDLKASAHLSTDPAVTALVPLIEHCDEWLRKLAYDELELNFAESSRLYKIATTLKSLDDVKQFWLSAETHARPPHHDDPTVIAPGFPWEALSRARAMSAHRHGYVFFKKTDEVELSKLPEHENTLGQELTRLKGMVITRMLNPRPQGALLMIEAKQVIALPPQVAAPGGWTAL